MTWTADILNLIDDLRGGTLRKLDTLASHPPTGAEAFKAWSALEETLRLRDAVNPVGAAARTFPDERDPRSRGLAALITSVIASVEAALDRGEQDPVDGVYRMKDFPHKFLFSGGTCAAASWCVRVETQKDWQNGDRPGLRPDHPLRSIAPIVQHDGQKALCVALSADVDAPFFFRQSTIARNTAEIIERLATIERERQRMKAGIERDRIEAARRLEEEAHRIRSGVTVW